MRPSRAALRIRHLNARTPDDLLQYLSNHGFKNSRLLAAFRRVERALFIPPEHAYLAYNDEPIPIGYGQVTSQPSLIAKMIDALQLKTNDRVLEIGTGMGFQTGLLAYLSKEVISIELNPILAHHARANLRAAGIHNVQIFPGDGTLGKPEFAPYHAMIGSAAAPQVPPPLADQLVQGGRIVFPIGPGGNEKVELFKKSRKKLISLACIAHASFVQMHGVYGHDRS